MAATSAAREAVALSDPEELLAWYFPVPEAGYAFCRRCGSSLFWQSTSTPDQLSICAGTLDPPTGLRTTQAWWVSQASDYFDRPRLPERQRE
jgi:hypothetical protein